MRTDQEIWDDIALGDTNLQLEKDKFPLNFNALLILEVLLDNRQYLKQIFEKPACAEGISYVDRGDPDAEDFVRTDLVADAAWHELDLSSIVPAEGASQLVHLKAKVEAEISEKKILFSTSGQVNDINLVRLGTQVPNIERAIDTFVKMDADRKIQYKMDSEGVTEPDAYARWRLDESSGNVAPDDSGNGRDGVLLNMEDEDWVAGHENNCLKFDGANEYVNCGDIANFERDEAFSVEAWFKTDSISSVSIISKMGHLAPYAGWELGFAGLGKLRVYICNSYSGNCITVYNNTINFADGNWHHVIMTYDGSSTAAGVHVYVDNIDLPLIIQFDSLTGSIQNNHICSIASRNGTLLYFPGYLDEVIIYDGVVLPSPNDAWFQATLSVRGWFKQ